MGHGLSNALTKGAHVGRLKAVTGCDATDISDSGFRMGHGVAWRRESHHHMLSWDEPVTTVLFQRVSGRCYFADPSVTRPHGLKLDEI
jgi:hypothetical protein